MNKFVEATAVQQNKAQTFNLGTTNYSSLSACVDLFAIVGNRNQQFFKEFELAAQENWDVAVRILLWARDIRGGAGERQTFRNLLKYMEEKHPQVLVKLLPKIPEVGRWDDLLIFEHDYVKTTAFSLIRDALNKGDALCAKWMPRQSTGKAGRKRGRKGRHDAAELRKFLALSPKDYRKKLANCTKVVETQMCSNTWSDINYEHVPSLAAARYQKAFNKHDHEGYEAYKAKLETGEAKINVGAVYPYDVIKSLDQGDQKVAVAQWAALPNFMGEEKIIPMVDVSGSMYNWNYYNQRGADVKGNVTPIEVAISLGLYCADKMEGSYHGMFLTFSGTPELQRLKGNLVEKYNQIRKAHWQMNTNIEAAMDKILHLALDNNVPAEDMPDMLLVLSDMEFDACVEGEKRIYDITNKKFVVVGYKMPKVVFWNLNSRSGNFPVTFNQNGTALVSGFSPAILKSILAADLEEFTPEAVMLKTVMIDRYRSTALPPKYWELRYHEGYSEDMNPEEYAALVDQLLFELRQLHPFRGDSKDYSTLYHASKVIGYENVPGLLCEIGLRQGSGLKAIFDGIIPSGQPRTVISIDPFGSIPYEGRDGEVVEEHNYSNAMQKESLELVYRFLQAYPQINFLFFPLEDTEFFKRYGDGIPVYADKKKEMYNQYALIHFDGPHTTDAIMTETGWFINRTVPGSRFVYDDVTHFFDHDKLQNYLEIQGWEMTEKNKWKSVFKRVKSI